MARFGPLLFSRAPRCSDCARPTGVSRDCCVPYCVPAVRAPRVFRKSLYPTGSLGAGEPGCLRDLLASSLRSASCPRFALASGLPAPSAHRWDCRLGRCSARRPRRPIQVSRRRPPANHSQVLLIFRVSSRDFRIRSRLPACRGSIDVKFCFGGRITDVSGQWRQRRPLVKNAENGAVI